MLLGQEEWEDLLPENCRSWIMDVNMLWAVLSRRVVGERDSEVKNKVHRKTRKFQICLY